LFYRANADAIRPLHEWTGIFPQYWHHQLTRVKERADATFEALLEQMGPGNEGAAGVPMPICGRSHVEPLVSPPGAALGSPQASGRACAGIYGPGADENPFAVARPAAVASA
jgi:hypothetical protein